MGDMGYKEDAVQGVYGEALDTMMQEVRDGAESMAMLDVLERMCRRAQLEAAKRVGTFEFASLSVSDILAVMGRPDCYEAVRICKEKAEEKEAEA
nr:MAG TPA: hypothetical protein [Caudoviricetes sp.]